MSNNQVQKLRGTTFMAFNRKSGVLTTITLHKNKQATINGVTSDFNQNEWYY